VPHLKVVRIAQTAFSDWRRGVSGCYAAEANMDQFVRSQNVARYRRLLERVTDEADRQQIINLLAEERQKQKTAGNSV